MAPLGGYIYQVMHGLYEIAKNSNINTKVGIEITDDISIDDGKIVTQQQLKKTNSGFAYSDKSKNLWNTLDIWISYVKANDPNVKTTKFVFVTNSKSDDTHIIYSLKKDLSEDEVDAFIKLLEAKTSESEEVMKLQAACLKAENRDYLRQILLNCSLVDNEQSIASQVDLIEYLPVPSGVDKSLYAESIIGWYVSNVLTAIATDQPIWISRVDFNNACNGATISALGAFTVGEQEIDLPVDNEFLKNLDQKCYIKQLQLIEMTKPNDRTLAVEDFFRFSRAKDNSISSGNILPDEWKKEEKRLQEFWHRESQMLQYESSADISRSLLGRRIFAASQSLHKNSMPLLNGFNRESFIICGHYHSLADREIVWWHPDYHDLKDK